MATCFADGKIADEVQHINSILVSETLHNNLNSFMLLQIVIYKKRSIIVHGIFNSILVYFSYRKYHYLILYEKFAKRQHSISCKFTLVIWKGWSLRNRYMLYCKNTFMSFRIRCYLEILFFVWIYTNLRFYNIW